MHVSKTLSEKCSQNLYEHISMFGNGLSVQKHYPKELLNNVVKACWLNVFYYLLQNNEQQHLLKTDCCKGNFFQNTVSLQSLSVYYKESRGAKCQGTGVVVGSQLDPIKIQTAHLMSQRILLTLCAMLSHSCISKVLHRNSD